MASQLKSGSPTYGNMYELYVIAAVVVGGTSLSGGEGKMLGTLIGAFIIAVIQNGMNLTSVESYTQKVVLGLVILGAVLLDRLRHRAVTRLAVAAANGRRGGRTGSAFNAPAHGIDGRKGGVDKLKTFPQRLVADFMPRLVIRRTSLSAGS